MVKFENADLLLNASKADATQKIMRATSGRDVIAVLDFVGSAKMPLPQVRGHKMRLRNYRLAQPRGAPHPPIQAMVIKELSWAPYGAT